MKAKSETTHGFGRYRVNSLVRIRARDKRGPPMNTTERIPVWSSVRGKYTPWITYRGTYICLILIDLFRLEYMQIIIEEIKL